MGSMLYIYIYIYIYINIIINKYNFRCQLINNNNIYLKSNIQYQWTYNDIHSNHRRYTL